MGKLSEQRIAVDKFLTHNLVKIRGGGYSTSSIGRGKISTKLVEQAICIEGLEEKIERQAVEIKELLDRIETFVVNEPDDSHLYDWDGNEVETAQA